MNKSPSAHRIPKVSHAFEVRLFLSRQLDPGLRRTLRSNRKLPKPRQARGILMLVDPLAVRPVASHACHSLGQNLHVRPHTVNTWQCMAAQAGVHRRRVLVAEPQQLDHVLTALARELPVGNLVLVCLLVDLHFCHAANHRRTLVRKVRPVPFLIVTALARRRRSGPRRQRGSALRALPARVLGHLPAARLLTEG